MKFYAFFLSLLLVLPLFGFVAASPAWSREKAPEIQNIVVTSADGSLCLSASVRGAFTEELRKDLRAGRELVFRFSVELERKRSGWLDESLKEVTHSHALRYDEKSESYVFTPEHGKPDQTRKTQSLREAEQWMSSFGPLPVVPLTRLFADSPYAIHIQAVLKPGSLPSFFFRPLGGIHTDRRTIEFRY